MADEQKNGKVDNKLIQTACLAYGIQPKYVLSSTVNGDEAVIVTQGGAKVRFKAGMKVEQLDEISVSGINPKNAKRKVVAGKAKAE